mmetsp:Transcript_45800/g.90207  ORF Transcript_45800/g.90207 Transcript_45800/m.90207 type:complete len:85 (-) Transcript_45800:308-562(-)
MVPMRSDLFFRTSLDSVLFCMQMNDLYACMHGCTIAMLHLSREMGGARMSYVSVCLGDWGGRKEERAGKEVHPETPNMNESRNE